VTGGPEFNGQGPSPVASATLLPHTARLEFTSTRSGTFIFNPGRPDERRIPIVSYLQGLPLIAEIRAKQGGMAKMAQAQG